jgi:transcriptional regulator with XRE-family HTH domain
MCVECGRPRFARNLCSACYSAHWRRGDVDRYPEVTRVEPPIPEGLDPLLRQLVQRRRDLGISRTMLSRALGNSNASPVSVVEEGRRQPGIAVLRRWAEALGCELAVVPLDSDGEMEHDPVKLLTRAQRREQVRKLAQHNHYKFSAKEIAAKAGVSVRAVHRARERL